MPRQLAAKLPKQGALSSTAPRPRSVQSLQAKLPPPVLQLQRTLGNRRFAQLIRARRVDPQGKIIGMQRKLIVGAANDQYEQEADRVARQAMSMSDSQANPQRGISAEEDKDKVLQTKPGTDSIMPFIQRDKIPHGTVTWDDFKGKVPKKAKHEAATYSDFEDPDLKAPIPDIAPVDTGEPCKVKGKDSTRFTVDAAIDSTKVEVKSFMDQDKSWHKSWTTDEAARRAKCEEEWKPKCKKALGKQIAKIKKIVSKSKTSCEKQFDKIKKEATKQCQPFETDCKTAFKKGDARFTIEIGDSEIEVNTAKECTKVLLPECIAASMKDAEVSETVEGEAATAKSKAECKTVLAPELEKLLKDQMTWEATMGGASATVKKLEDCSTTFIDSCAKDLLQAGSDDLLKHEQAHFDLTEAMAQKAQSDLRALVETFPAEVDACGESAAKAKAKTVLASELAKMKKSYSANKKSMIKKQAQYDKETRHGVVEKKQTEWEEKISEGF